MRQTVRYFQREAQANWIAQHQPEIRARTDRYRLLSGYLNYRMSGRLADSVASQVGAIPFDDKNRRRAGANDWKWQALPITLCMLPDLVSAGTRIGSIGAQAAQDSGIPERLPLIAGAADKACEVPGAACLSPQIAWLSYGATATINTATTPHYLEATRFIPPQPAAVPGHYNSEVQITRGFWLVNWFKQQFGLHELQVAQQRGVTPQSRFDGLVNAVSPGAQARMLQPFWNPGI